MKKNIRALTILQGETSTSAVFARRDNHGNHDIYDNASQNIMRGHVHRGGRTIFKSISKRTTIYSIMIAVLASTFLTGCCMPPPSGVGVYIPPVGVNVYTPPLLYGGPYYRPRYWHRRRPHHW